MGQLIEKQKTYLSKTCCLTGYQGEYVFEKIKQSKDFFESEILRKWFEPLSEHIGTVYDIGANLGNHSIFFATHAPEAKVYAFEPFPKNYELLETNIEDNFLQKRVIPYQIALGEHSGLVRMRIGAAGNLGTAGVSDNGEVEAQMTTLDSMELPLPDFVKIDVEGLELAVLHGMQETLKKSQTLVWLETSSDNIVQVAEYLAQFEYELIAAEIASDGNLLFGKAGCLVVDSDFHVLQKMLSEAEKNRDFFWARRRLQSEYEYEKKKVEEITHQLGSMTSKFEYEQKKAGELKYQLSSMTSKFEYEQKKADNFSQQLNATISLLDREQTMAGELLRQLEEARSEYVRVRCRIEELQKQVTELSRILQIEQQEKEEIAELGEVYRVRADYFKELSGKRASQFEYEQKKAETLKNELADIKKQYESTVSYKFRRFVKRVKRTIKPILFPIVQKVYNWAYRYPKLLKLFSKLNKFFHVFPYPDAVIFYGRPAPVTTVSTTETLIQPKTDDVLIERKPKRLRDMNVAMIVDEFTYNSFRYECNALPLEPLNWKNIFEENEIDLFFCESAWTGTDPDRRPWRGQVYGSCNFPKENRTVLFEILDYCKSHKIPTAFWNKEDPAHYEDKVHNFVDTAKRFDHVFTTASECVERYKNDYGLKSVHLLMFATQPRMFNPIETCEREDAVIFAGSWYNQHPVRCREMGDIFDGILAQEIPLIIYNRQSENSDPNHQFPEKYVPYVRPRLRYDQMDVAYKGSNMALNINTVVDSDTMFARRVFELMSSNTFVLSNYSSGMEKLFGDMVAFVDGTQPINIENVDEKRESALYNVLSYHTYEHRFEKMIRDIGIPFLKDREIVTLIYRVETLDEAQNCVNHFMAVTWEEKQAILLVSKHCDGETLRDIVTRFNFVNIQVVSEHYIQNYDETLELSTMYAVWADTEMTPRFIERAMLHWCYLPDKIGICEGGQRYTMGKKTGAMNTLVSSKEFKWDCNYEKDVYFI